MAGDEGDVHLLGEEEAEEEAEEGRSGDWRKPVALLRNAGPALLAPPEGSNKAEVAKKRVHNRRAIDEELGRGMAVVRPLPGKRRQAAAGGRRLKREAV